MNTDLIQQMPPCGQRTVPFADERSTAAAGVQETTQEMAKRVRIFVSGADHGRGNAEDAPAGSASHAAGLALPALGAMTRGDRSNGG